jgi:CRISPR-associated DxTHG motif protein
VIYVEVISFLGIPAGKLDPITKQYQEGRYRKVYYYWAGEECYTELFAIALMQFFKPKRLHLFVTEKSQKHSHYKEIQAAVGDKLNTIVINEGLTEQDLWGIFQEVTGVVSNNSRVVFDITHSFRSLPFLVFIATAYLRQVRNVKVEKIVYGAFEARDKETNRAPVFDLTPFVSLLDWLTGVQALRTRDDADQLAFLLQDAQSRPWRQKKDGLMDDVTMPRNLGGLASTIQRLSQAFHQARPIEIMENASKLEENLPDVKEEVEKWAIPFAVLLEMVAKEYTPFSAKNPEKLNIDNLHKQAAIIRRFADKGLVMPAMGLAREWLVSYTMLYVDPDNWLVRNSRLEVENKLNKMAPSNKDGKSCNELIDNMVAPDVINIPHIGGVIKVWSTIREIRNHVLHCGMREDPVKVDKVLSIVQNLPELIYGVLDEE